MRTLPNIVVSCTLFFLCNLANADTKSIQGTVIGTDGKPLSSEGVRAERLDAKANPTVTKTDGKGRYVFSNLSAGVYQVLATVKGVAKSRAKVSTQTGRVVIVNFDLRTPPNGNDKSVAGKTSTNQSDRIQQDNVSRMQQGLGGNINGMSFPGH